MWIHRNIGQIWLVHFCYLKNPVLSGRCARSTQPCDGVSNTVLWQKGRGSRITALALFSSLSGNLTGKAQLHNFFKLSITDLRRPSCNIWQKNKATLFELKSNYQDWTPSGDGLGLPVVLVRPIWSVSWWTQPLHWSAGWLREDRFPSFSLFFVYLSFSPSLLAHYKYTQIKSDSVELLRVVCVCVFSLDVIYKPAQFSIQVLLSQSFEIGLQMFKLLHAGVVETLKDNVYKSKHWKLTISVLLQFCFFALNNGYQSRFLLKGDFSIVVDSSLLLSLLTNVNSCCPQLSTLL